RCFGVRPLAGLGACLREGFAAAHFVQPIVRARRALPKARPLWTLQSRLFSHHLNAICILLLPKVVLRCFGGKERISSIASPRQGLDCATVAGTTSSPAGQSQSGSAVVRLTKWCQLRSRNLNP